MSARALYAIILLAATMSPLASAAPSDAPQRGGVEALSPEVRAMLTAEMVELQKAVSAIAPALAAGEWDAIAAIGRRMHDSYILARKLTTVQRQELERVLPEHFKQLDMAFHAQAQRLAEAAGKRDAELSGFHYFRVLDTCVACHSAYATHKFPGFDPAAPAPHHH